MTAAKPAPCATCGAPTDASYRLCRDCVTARTVAERAGQGLPPTVQDGATLHRLAVLIDGPKTSSSHPTGSTTPAPPSQPHGTPAAVGAAPTHGDAAGAGNP